MSDACYVRCRELTHLGQRDWTQRVSCGMRVSGSVAWSLPGGRRRIHDVKPHFVHRNPSKLIEHICGGEFRQHSVSRDQRYVELTSIFLLSSTCRDKFIRTKDWLLRKTDRRTFLRPAQEHPLPCLRTSFPYPNRLTCDAAQKPSSSNMINPAVNPIPCKVGVSET